MGRAEDFVICKICGAKRKSLPQHLKHAHDMTPSEYKREYDADYVISESMRASFSSSKRKREGKKFQSRTREQVIKEIVEIEKNHKGYLYGADLRKKDYTLYRQMTYLFGGWKSFCKETGIEMKERLNESRWKRRVKKRIRDKKSLLREVVAKYEPNLVNYAERKYGSFNKGLKAIDIEPPDKPLYWSEDKVLKIANEILESKGYINQSYFNEYSTALTQSMSKDLNLTIAEFCEKYKLTYQNQGENRFVVFDNQGKREEIYFLGVKSKMFKYYLEKGIPYFLKDLEDKVVKEMRKLEKQMGVISVAIVKKHDVWVRNALRNVLKVNSIADFFVKHRISHFRKSTKDCIVYKKDGSYEKMVFYDQSVEEIKRYTEKGNAFYKQDMEARVVMTLKFLESKYGFVDKEVIKNFDSWLEYYMTRFLKISSRYQFYDRYKVNHKMEGDCYRIYDENGVGEKVSFLGHSKSEIKFYISKGAKYYLEETEKEVVRQLWEIAQRDGQVTHEAFRSYDNNLMNTIVRVLKLNKGYSHLCHKWGIPFKGKIRA